jgi:CDP-paratose 2-epimerase
VSFNHICITGGAGFVGSHLALAFREALPGATVTAVDSLKRRGSELALRRLHEGGVRFVHADIRCPEDLADLPEMDLLVDCSAEPSVQAGAHGSPLYVLNTNLQGTVHCLELARLRGAAFLFLSTSRVYPLLALNEAAREETPTRFRFTANQTLPGVGPDGVTEDFPLTGARTYYGASKLAGEVVLQEYVHAHGLRAIVNRCGVIAGPWQMGKVDQGVVTLWVARHHFKKPLAYMGYGGTGKQVRDVIHVRDIARLLLLQMADLSKWDGRVYNVGGGTACSTSLLELTTLCQEVTGNTIPVEPRLETSPMDVPVYITDAARVKADFPWSPTHDLRAIVNETHAWIREHEADLAPVLG